MALPVRKSYKGAPASTTLSSGINNSATSFAVAAVTGWPTTFPFYAVIDPGTAKEEKIKVTGIASTTLTVVRGQDDTTAVTHDASATVYPVFTALEADEANQIASVMTTKGDLIATDGSTINRLAVGATNTHVLQVDSTATNGFKWGQVATAGIADSAVTSAKIADGTIVDADVNASAAIALSKLATGALPTAITVASANIVDGTIATADLADGSVTSAKIADSTIVAGDIATATLKLLCPVGTIAAYGGAAAPTGWLLCDGSAISGSYTELIALVGANTPDMKGKFVLGKAASGTGSTLLGSGGSTTIAEANLPSHSHGLNSHTHTINHDHAASGTHSHTTSGVGIYDSGSNGVWGLIATNATGNLNANIQNTVASPTGSSTVNLDNFTGDSGGPSTANTTTTGSGTAYYQPFVAVSYIIKHDY